MPVDLAPITGSEPGSFAHRVICERHPAIIKDLQTSYPYPRQQQAQLDELEHETLHGTITRLPHGAPDREHWEMSGDGFYSRRWTDVPFLWAESYFYRRVLQAVQYFEPGPWYRLDPFRAKKTSELHDQRVAMLLEQLDATGPITDRDAFAVFRHGAVWGNKADLGFEMGRQAAGLTASHGPSPQLLVDDTTAAWTYLTEQRPRSIIVIADNAGPELICDLLLIDFLLRDPDRTIEIHLKPDPYYVSDATPADLLDALHLLANAAPAARHVATRLTDQMRTDTLQLHTDAFYCRPERLDDAPTQLHERYVAANLVIAKATSTTADSSETPTTTPPRHSPTPAATFRPGSSRCVPLSPMSSSDSTPTPSPHRTPLTPHGAQTDHAPSSRRSRRNRLDSAAPSRELGPAREAQSPRTCQGCPCTTMSRTEQEVERFVHAKQRSATGQRESGHRGKRSREGMPRCGVPIARVRARG